MVRERVNVGEVNETCGGLISPVGNEGITWRAKTSSEKPLWTSACVSPCCEDINRFTRLEIVLLLGDEMQVPRT